MVEREIEPYPMGFRQRNQKPRADLKFLLPLLQTIQDAGGQAKPVEVYEALAKKLDLPHWLRHLRALAVKAGEINVWARRSIRPASHYLSKAGENHHCWFTRNSKLAQVTINDLLDDKVRPSDLSISVSIRPNIDFCRLRLFVDVARKS